MSKVYGSLINRLEENKNYLNRDELKEGDDITQYMYSDRHCYYIEKVIDQKHIIVRPYYVCADRSKEGGIGHQNWLYFKTNKDMQRYLNECIDNGSLSNVQKANLDEVKESSGEEWVYRYGKWCRVDREWYGQKLDKPRYSKVGNVSFGVKNYYYDWEF